jgi:hypothetical protein
LPASLAWGSGLSARILSSQIELLFRVLQLPLFRELLDDRAGNRRALSHNANNIERQQTRYKCTDICVHDR